MIANKLFARSSVAQSSKTLSRHLAQKPLNSQLTRPLLFSQNHRNFYSNYGGATCYFGCIVFVSEKYACLVHRLQRYDRTLNSGLNFKIPLIDSIEYVHDLREQVIEIDSQVAVTQDNVALHIDGVLYLQIEEPDKASYNVENISQAITNLAQTTMRSEIGKISLDKTFEEREYLNSNIVAAIDKET